MNTRHWTSFRLDRAFAFHRKMPPFKWHDCCSHYFFSFLKINFWAQNLFSLRFTIHFCYQPNVCFSRLSIKKYPVETTPLPQSKWVCKWTHSQLYLERGGRGKEKNDGKKGKGGGGGGSKNGYATIGYSSSFPVEKWKKMRIYSISSERTVLNSPERTQVK